MHPLRKLVEASTAEQLDLLIHTTRCDVCTHCDLQQSPWDNQTAGEGRSRLSPLIVERIGSSEIWPNRVHFRSKGFLFLPFPYRHEANPWN